MTTYKCSIEWYFHVTLLRRYCRMLSKSAPHSEYCSAVTRQWVWFEYNSRNWDSHKASGRRT